MSEPTDPSTTPTPDDGDSDMTSSNATLVGIGLVVLIGVLAVVGIMAFGDGDDEVVAGGGSTTPPTSSVVPEPGPDDGPDEPAPEGPAGADSALVGLTEAEVRELYPLVRVVEIDGEPLMTTMDLQQGRINLAIEGDTVVGATTEGCDELGDDTPEWVTQACDPDPGSDGPTTFGKLLADPADDGILTLEVGTQGDQYHQGMTVRPAGDDTRVVTLDGTPLAAEDLLPDDVVWIWTGECRESSPVQCDLHAVVVDRPAG